MDLREDSQRQRLKLVANTHGSLHEDARRTMPADEEGEGGEDELDPVGMPLQSGPLTSSSQPDEGSLSSDELLETQVSAEQEQSTLKRKKLTQQKFYTIKVFESICFMNNGKKVLLQKSLPH